MTNKELDDTLVKLIEKSKPFEGDKLIAFYLSGIMVMLTEIAKRLPSEGFEK